MSLFSRMGHGLGLKQKYTRYTRYKNIKNLGYVFSQEYYEYLRMFRLLLCLAL